ncbi:fimbrillin family protein [Bacteroides sp. ET336]|uniref:fimbrillin family protein n=1 Tax=Bacteroides sp. ET336 TaxID=2972459 RepID=UPI0021ACCE35|nr:fimbrillin family protein [Bacteroides sp. ET336]MCR8894275.1 fimbrillin family protein [Bacteroides sp. ET336]MDN0058771.1 fimbrillin family protein [Bacteroides caecigallinarum]
MTTNFRLLAMAAVAMLAMNSCVKEENLNSGDKKGTPVEFEMGVNSVSRTNTPDDGYATTFVEGDEVGIFVYNGETPVVKNAHYKLNADGKWVAQGEAITAEKGVSYSYYAYYPYNAEATDATSVSLTVAGDQTTGYTGSDALMARSVNVAAGTTTVPLKYSHAFALVQVTLKGDLAAKDATVTLQNVYPTAAINLKDSIIKEAAGALGTVAMKACSTPFNYRAIVPAQTITKDNGILTTSSNGKNYKFTYSVDVPYESGKLRQFNVTLGATPDKTTIEIDEGTISNWEDGSTVEGGEGNTEEIVPTYINPIGSTLADVINAPNFEEDIWFGLKQNANTPGVEYSIQDDGSTDWKKAICLKYTSTWDYDYDNGNDTGGNPKPKGKKFTDSWYIGTIGYYHCSTEVPVNQGIYKVSLKIKGELDTQYNEMSKLVFTCRNAKNNASFAISKSTSEGTFTATTVTIIPEANKTWEDLVLYINFAKKSEKAPGGNVEMTDSDSTDFTKFDLRVYTNNPVKTTPEGEDLSNTATIYISDVKMEPYVAE